MNNEFTHLTIEMRLHKAIRRHGETLREVHIILSLAHLPGGQPNGASNVNAQAGGQLRKGHRFRVHCCLIAGIALDIVEILRCDVLAEQMTQAQSRATLCW